MACTWMDRAKEPWQIGQVIIITLCLWMNGVKDIKVFTKCSMKLKGQLVRYLVGLVGTVLIIIILNRLIT